MLFRVDWQHPSMPSRARWQVNHRAIDTRSREFVSRACDLMITVTRSDDTDIKQLSTESFAWFYRNVTKWENQNNSKLCHRHEKRLSFHVVVPTVPTCFSCQWCMTVKNTPAPFIGSMWEARGTRHYHDRKTADLPGTYRSPIVTHGIMSRGCS